MNLFKRLRALFRRASAESDLQREIEFHLQMEAQANERAGMSPDAARRTAVRAFGGVEQAKEVCRDSWGVRLIENLWQDLAYGWRGVRRNRGFAAIVVLTLALGIGANTAIFSVVDGVLLRDLPYSTPDRLLMLNQAAPRAGQPSFGFSVPDFMDFRARNRTFSALAEYHSMYFILLGRAEPERVQTGVVSDNFFDLLGVKPILGRGFLPGEDKPGAAPVLVLSYDYWQNSFGGDPKVVGRVFEMNNKPHTVVGVLPPLPKFPNADQVFMPASACPFRGAANMISNRDARMLSNVFGRLRDGVSAPQAQADLRRVGIELCGEFPKSYPKDDGYTVDVEGIAQAFTGGARNPLLLLLAMSGFVLLIACANVANLVLARLARRDRELAVRIAMGAGRFRLVRMLLTESLLLAVLGGAFGLLLATVGVHVLATYAAKYLPRANEIGINGTVLAFTSVVTLVTALLFGSRPPLPTGNSLALSLKDGARGATSSRKRLRALLVVGQVAVSVPLLVGAGLAAHHLYNLQHVDPGLDTSHVLAANVSLNWTQYDSLPKQLGFWTRAIEEVRKLPGVDSAAVAGAEPLNGFANNVVNFRIERPLRGADTATPHAVAMASTEDYFTTVGQKLLRGRFFRATDSHSSAQVAIINQALASHYWPDLNPVGQRVTPDDGKTWFTIVGVVTNARQELDAAPKEEIHVPLSDTNGFMAATVLLRTTSQPARLTAELRQAIHRVDPQQPITSIETLDQVKSTLLAPPRLTTSLLGLFAGVALLITSAGIGGILAFSVSQRTQEIGIRMALGAGRSDILWMVLRQGLVLVGLGLAFGAIGSLIVSRMMSAMLSGMTPTDPLTFIAAVFALVGIALLASIVPARRAVSVSPVVALQA